MLPRVSVLMPVYNGGRYIREAMDGIVEQTYLDWEFVIVDDCSTDDTSEILDERLDPRLVRIRNEVNLGVAASLNRGLEAVRGCYVARQDADDWSAPERIAAQVDYLDAHPSVDVVGSWTIVVDADGTPIGKLEPVAAPQAVGEALPMYNCITHGSIMARTDTIRVARGYRQVPHAEDYDLWLRLTDDRPAIANEPRSLYHLRRHDASVTSRHHGLAVAAAFVVQHAADQRRRGRADPLEELDPDGMLRLVSQVADGRSKLGRLSRTTRQWAEARRLLDQGRPLAAVGPLAGVLLRSPAYGPLWHDVRVALSNRLRGETPR